MKNKILIIILAVAAISLSKVKAQVDTIMPPGNRDAQNENRTPDSAQYDMNNRDVNHEKKITPQHGNGMPDHNSSTMHRASPPIHKTATDSSAMQKKPGVMIEPSNQPVAPIKPVTPVRPSQPVRRTADTATTKNKKAMYLVPDSTLNKNKHK